MSNSTVYKRRDSVVTLLRKMGIDKESYYKFIEAVDGGFKLNMSAPTKPSAKVKAKEVAKAKAEDAAIKPLKDKIKANAKVVAKTIVKAKKVPTVVRYEEIKAPKKPTKPRDKNTETCSYVARAMITDGKTNAEVWAVIQPRFNLTDAQKHYPSWYRSAMKRGA